MKHSGADFGIRSSRGEAYRLRRFQEKLNLYGFVWKNNLSRIGALQHAGV